MKEVAETILLSGSGHFLLLISTNCECAQDGLGDD
jgi:hypothetical protein